MAAKGPVHAQEPPWGFQGRPGMLVTQVLPSQCGSHCPPNRSPQPSTASVLTGGAEGRCPFQGLTKAWAHRFLSLVGRWAHPRQLLRPRVAEPTAAASLRPDEPHSPLSPPQPDPGCPWPLPQVPRASQGRHVDCAAHHPRTQLRSPEEQPLHRDREGASANTGFQTCLRNEPANSATSSA